MQMTVGADAPGFDAVAIFGSPMVVFAFGSFLAPAPLNGRSSRGGLL